MSNCPSQILGSCTVQSAISTQWNYNEGNQWCRPPTNSFIAVTWNEDSQWSHLIWMALSFPAHAEVAILKGCFNCCFWQTAARLFMGSSPPTLVALAVGRREGKYFVQAGFLIITICCCPYILHFLKKNSAWFTSLFSRILSSVQGWNKYLQILKIH